MLTRVRVWVGLVLSVICWVGTVAASTPDISGTWTGSARGTNFHEETMTNEDGSMSTSPVSHAATGMISATLTQTGNDLIVNMAIDSSDSGAEHITANLIGKAGNFVFWASGTIINSDGNPEDVFVTGHYGTKANKIGGTGLFYRTRDLTQVIFTLKKTSSAASTSGNFTVAPRDDTGGGSIDPPFNITGKASGKTYTFASTAKAASFTAPLSGTITNETKTAVINFNGSETLSFACTQFDCGKAVIFAGNYASEYLVSFGRSTDTSAAGNAWIIGQTRMIELRFSVKKVQ